MPTFPENAYVHQASTLIEQRTGLAVSAQFPNNLETIFNDIAQGNLARLVHVLHETPETAPAWQRLLQTLAIGETYFFRYQPYFQLLRNYILPALISQRRRSIMPTLNIWSAGCATGEEPYSIAITLQENIPDVQRWAVQLVGTDINLHALQAAQNGIYRRWSFRHTSPDFQARYFEAASGGLQQLKPAIRKMVSFRHHNLLAAPPLASLDVIFCCNVLIYFKPDAVEQVETMLYEALAPGGWLVLGQAEMLRFGRERWTTHIFPDAVAYQKPVAGGVTTKSHARPLPTAVAAASAAAPPAYPDAVRAVRRKDYDTADRILSDILEQNPAYAPAHVLLGSIFANRQALPEANMHLDRALRIDSLQADAHYLRGLLHLELGKTDAAREALRAALYCRRGHTLAAMILGHLYAQGGENDRARRIWKEALHVLDGLAPDTPVSDISDITAGAASAFISAQVQQLRG